MTSLLSIWIEQKDFFEEKTIAQVISIAGDGKLRDGNQTSIQLRELFANVPSTTIERYIDECLSWKDPDKGFVLQDLVNEVGTRLGFSIEHGVYRGSGLKIGFDGIWKAKDGYSLVIEVKTTDAYQINLETQAKYRQDLIGDNQIEEDSSSILFIVGGKDTAGLESQTRGSRHAWDIRIIGIDALLRLMRVKENLMDTGTVAQIQEILKPLEYTRLDSLIDIFFNASEDLQSVEITGDVEEEKGKTSKRVPVQFHDECVERISTHLRMPLIKQGRSTYINGDGTVHLLCIISKEYQHPEMTGYWYAFHRHVQEFLNEGETSFVAFGCGSAEQIVIMPSAEFQKYLPDMHTTESDKRFYWHVRMFNKEGTFLLNKPSDDGIDVTQYLIK